MIAGGSELHHEANYSRGAFCATCAPFAGYELTRACVGNGAEDGSGAAVDHLAKVHGDGKQEHEEKEGEVE